jgi:glyoxylase-like metal-dependent hydrolase (beta-lactamase superfamily II)
MSYRGKVKPGSPDVRELSHLMITKASVGPMDNNAYLLRCRHTDEQVLIDAAAEPDTLLSLVGPGGLARVITTHQHRDHWSALAEVVKATGAETMAGEADAPGIPVPTARTLVEGDQVAVGSSRLDVIHLVGHTPGSVALLYDDPDGPPHLFTGDSLFPGGVGNTHGNPDDFASLINDVETKIFDRLPDETWIYPGHGNDTTLGVERPHLPEWRARGW